MSTVNLTFRGLNIEAEMEEYDPGVRTYPNGDPGYPPSGGGCAGYTWDVDDIGEVLRELEIEEELRGPIRGFVRSLGRLPKFVTWMIDDRWADDIAEAACEEFAEQEL